MKHGMIRVRTGEPDYSSLPDMEYDWEHTVYGNVKEIFPDDAPSPLGKAVVTTTDVDANLYHDLISGRSVTCIIHMANQTVIDFHSKLQSNIETATFGSEYVAARTCMEEQNIDLRIAFRYLGVNVAHSTMMFGDNESVVTPLPSPIPSSRADQEPR